MGVVWLARDERLGVEVALKFLPAEIYNDPAALDDLRREALKCRGLSHPNIIRIHDFHEHAGEPPFISMEYVEGSTLHALRNQQEQRLFAWEFIQPLVRQLCEALDYAHSEKVIHRDLKPANVMLDNRGRMKLADFGIAAAASDSMSRVSLRGNTSGTPGYMSPQQMDGRAPRISDDVYSLGAMIYELLTSKPPFHRGDIAYQARNLPPDPMEDRLAEFGLTNTIPPDVAALVMACLAKEPEQRPLSARAVAEWLGIPVASSPPIEAQEAPPSLEEPPSPPPNQRRWLWPAIAAGAIAVAIVTGGAFFLRKKSGSSPPQTSVNDQKPGKNKEVSSASVIHGPITNTANGHSYYLLSSKTWTASEMEARALGGHLATVRNQAENDWILKTFDKFDGVRRCLWIGLHNFGLKKEFEWISGEKVSFLNWDNTEPNNLRVEARQNYVHMWDSDSTLVLEGMHMRLPGKWNNGRDDALSINVAVYGVVEVSAIEKKDAAFFDKDAPFKDGIASTFALARRPAISFVGTLPGTIWLASDSDGEKYCFQFAPNGVLNYESQRGIQPSGKWQQDGAGISIDINDGFTLFSGTISGNKMNGKALSKNGKNWSWEAIPQN